MKVNRVLGTLTDANQERSTGKQEQETDAGGIKVNVINDVLLMMRAFI